MRKKRYHLSKEGFSMHKVRITANGRVQGVGFRFSTKILADSLGIYGSAENQDDGSVKIIAMSEDKRLLQQFVEQVKRSPAPFGRVDSFQLERDESITETHRFTTN